jgi:hypothetical protein
MQPQAVGNSNWRTYRRSLIGISLPTRLAAAKVILDNCRSFMSPDALSVAAKCPQNVFRKE